MHNKLDFRDAFKCVQKDEENSIDDETLSDNDSLSDGSDDGSDDGFIFPYKRKKEDSDEKVDSIYVRNNDRNEKGDCHDNIYKPIRSMRNKGGKKGGNIWKYVICDIVDNAFEAKAVEFVKAHWPHALTREESLDILMLQVHLRR